VSFVKGLLQTLADLPPEEHGSAITDAVASANVPATDISQQISDLFEEMYGDGGGDLSAEIVNQLEQLGQVADAVDVLVQAQAAQAARAQEIGQKIEGLKQNIDAIEAVASGGDDTGAGDGTDPTADPTAAPDDTAPVDDTTVPADAPVGDVPVPDLTDVPAEGDIPVDDGLAALATDGNPAPAAPAAPQLADGQPPAAPTAPAAPAGAPAPAVDPEPAAPQLADDQPPAAPAAPAADPTTDPAAAEPSTDDAPAADPAVPVVSPAPTPEVVHASVNTNTPVPLGHTAPDNLPAQAHAPAAPTFSLVAAADVPGFAAGNPIDNGLAGLANAWEVRMMPMVTGNVNSGRDGDRTRVGIARIQRHMPEEFRIQDGRNSTDVKEKIDHACDETRLPGGSLTASAGWCAPSEQLYDLCPIRMTQEGLITLPQIQTQRGGIRYPADFDWAAVWSSIGFELTEEEVIAGREKRCVEVPCPQEWTECRMDVDGLCIRTPILMERGWPERVQQFFEGALLIHAHKQNAKKLARMEALSERVIIPGPRPGTNPTDPVVDPHGPGAVESLLSILELQVQYQRYRDRLSQSGGGTLEMIAPFWIRGVLKSDLRKKLGIDNRWSISDSQIDGYLRNCGVNPQYVYDWQDSFEHPMNPGGFGGPIPMRWPNNVKLMLYPSGTFFELSDDVIILDGIYDHASLIKNVYTGLFTEEGWMVCKRCLDSYVIELDLCANGLSGSHIEVDCDKRPPAPGGKLLPAAVPCPA
jgi:hypothetical protein